jgi:hypothetical protein
MSKKQTHMEWLRERHLQQEARGEQLLAAFGSITLAELAQGCGLAGLNEVRPDADHIIGKALDASYEHEFFPVPETDAELAEFMRGWLDAPDRDQFARQWVAEHQSQVQS